MKYEFLFGHCWHTQARIMTIPFGQTHNMTSFRFLLSFSLVWTVSFNRNFCNLSEQGGGGVLENSSEVKVSVPSILHLSGFFCKILDALRAVWMRFAHYGCASRILDALRAFGMRFAHLGCSCSV